MTARDWLDLLTVVTLLLGVALGVVAWIRALRDDDEPE